MLFTIIKVLGIIVLLMAIFLMGRQIYKFRPHPQWHWHASRRKKLFIVASSSVICACLIAMSLIIYANNTVQPYHLPPLSELPPLPTLP